MAQLNLPSSMAHGGVPLDLQKTAVACESAEGNLEEPLAKRARPLAANVRANGEADSLQTDDAAVPIEVEEACIAAAVDVSNCVACDADDDDAVELDAPKQEGVPIGPPLLSEPDVCGLLVGESVILQGLVKMTEYNERRAIVIRWVRGVER